MIFAEGGFWIVGEVIALLYFKGSDYSTVQFLIRITRNHFLKYEGGDV